MKKIIKLLACIAAATVAFSCMEEANPETPAAGESNYDGPTVTLEFKVSKEDTKTVFEDGNHDWVEGDQIKIVYTVDGKSFDSIGGIHKNDDEDWVVRAEIAQDADDTYYAVYPASTEYFLEPKEGETELTFTARIPRYQDGSFENANLMAAKTTKEAPTFAFKNLTHILKFNLSEGHGFDNLEFASNSETILTGRHYVDLSGDAPSLLYNSNGNTNSKYVTVENLAGKHGVFYIGVLPIDAVADASKLPSMSTGVAIRAKKKGENYKYFAMSRNGIDNKRSKITPLGSIDEHLRENVWYITPTGTGNGDQDSPAGISKLIELMSKIELNNGKTTSTIHQWRLANAVINLAAGEYNIPEANGGATFEPKLTEHVDLTIKGEEGTVLTTIETADVRIFRFKDIKAGNVTFDGITFKGTGETGVSAVGVATYCSGSTTGTFTYKNCKFTDFNNTNTGSHGAVILANGEGKRTMNFESCTFEKNVSASNGTLANMETNTTMTFTDCTFDNNTAKYGGAIYCTKGTVHIAGCIFNNNIATSYGGALANSVGTFTIDNCNFKGNNGGSEGGAVFSYGEKPGTSNVTAYEGITETYVYNSVFDGNIASSQGGAIKVHGNTNLVVVNSTMLNNTATHGIIRLRAQDNKASAIPNVKAWIINCTISGNNLESVYNQSCTAYIYNSVLNDSKSFVANQPAGSTTIKNSMFYDTSYYNVTEGTLTGKNGVSTLTDGIATMEASAVGTYADGVYSVTGAALETGMSSTDLAALAEEIKAVMPDFDATKLTVDQKGNSREGKKVMGAYVGM